MKEITEIERNNDDCRILSIVLTKFHDNSCSIDFQILNTLTGDEETIEQLEWENLFDVTGFAKPCLLASLLEEKYYMLIDPVEEWTEKLSRDFILDARKNSNDILDALKSITATRLFMRILDEYLVDNTYQDRKRFISMYRDGFLNTNNLCESTLEVARTTEDMYDLLNTQAYLVADCLKIVEKDISKDDIMKVLTDNSVFAI